MAVITLSGRDKHSLQMFYSHTSRYGPRPPPPGGLHGSRLPPFPQEIGNFTRFATFSEYSRTTSLKNSSYPLKREEPYVTSPTEDGDSMASSRAESPSSVFRIESVASSSAPTPGTLTPVDPLLESEESVTPRAGSPVETDPVAREYASFTEVDDLISDLDISSRLAKEYDRLEAVDDLLEPLHSPKKFYSSLELSGESRQKHEYLSRAGARGEKPLIISSNSAFSPHGSYYSSYATPYTSTNTVYYSAEDHLNQDPSLMDKEGPSQDVTTSRVITETVQMTTTGIITPPPGQRVPSPADTITITDAFGQPEGTSQDRLSDEEELEEFSRSQAVRRSILPGQRRHPTVLSNPDDGVIHPKVVDADDEWEHAGSEEYSYPIMRPRLAEGGDITSEEGFSYTTADDGYGRYHSPVSDDIPELEYDGQKTPTPQASEKSYPKVNVSTPDVSRDFPKVSLPEKLTRSEEVIYAEVTKEKPEQSHKSTQKGHHPIEPSPSYILEETTTEERIEETTETFLDNRDYRNFKTRSPLHPHRVYSEYHSVPIVRREPYGGRVLKMVTEMGSATIGGISPALSANAAKSFLEATDKEKKELQGLNDRLGNYIDRVKRLEEQNRKLVADLDELRGKWGKDTSEIKIKYSESLSTARKDIDDSARRKAEIDVKAARLRDDLAEYRSRYEDVQHRREADREKISQWTNAIADAQSELEMLRARWKQLTDEEKRLNADNARIWEELQKARNDLDEETIGRIDFQNQVQTLMEELEFLRRVHEQEVKELQALLAQAPADTREFFKNELALAIRDIKDEYDYIAKQGKQDMESWYKLKVSEVQGSANRAAMESNYQREEVKRMRDNIGDLRGKLGDLENKNALLEKEVQNLNYQLTDDQRQYEAALNDRDATLRRMREECQTLVAELQGLLDTKQMLDAEIAIYRKMLEGEESRVGLRQMVEQVVKTHSLQQQEDTDSTRSVRGEVSTKTTFQRSAKGNVTIAECDPNGKFITLENTHRTKEENLGEHKLKRKLDGNRREIVYTIPANTVLKPGKSMKIYARDQGGIHNPPDSLVFEGENTWGIGANVVTSLVNKEGDERATHTQKTIQTGQ